MVDLWPPLLFIFFDELWIGYLFCGICAWLFWHLVVAHNTFFRNYLWGVCRVILSSSILVIFLSILNESCLEFYFVGSYCRFKIITLFCIDICQLTIMELVLVLTHIIVSYTLFCCLWSYPNLVFTKIWCAHWYFVDLTNILEHLHQFTLLQILRSNFNKYFFWTSSIRVKSSFGTDFNTFVEGCAW